MSMKKKNFWSAVLAMGLAATLSVGFVGCSDDDEPTPEIVTDNPLDKEVYYIAGKVTEGGIRRGLPGYLILFAPHAFAPQRQLSSSRPPSPLVFLLISTHFTATLGIPLTSTSLKNHSFKCSLWVKPIVFTSDLRSRLRSLYTQ